MYKEVEKTEPTVRSVAVVSETSLADHENGVSNSIKQTLRFFDEFSLEAHLYTPKPSTDTGDLYGAPISTGRTRRIRDFNVGTERSKVLRSQLEKQSPDVVHLASPFLLGWAGLRAARRLSIPSVAVYQTDMAEYAHRFVGDYIDEKIRGDTKWLKKLAGTNSENVAAALIARIHNTATVTLSPSTAATERLLQFGVDASRIYTWSRGVDMARFTPERANSDTARALHTAWSHEGQKTVVGYIGRLAPEKQVERLAELTDPQLQLVVVGDGLCRPELEKTLPPGTLFTGELHGEALADAYAALDVFVHTGSHETFGQTIQEAMASGKVVIAPNTGGPVDIISQPGENGFLLDFTTPGELPSLVHTIAHSETLRRQVGQRAVETMRPRSWRAKTSELVDYYSLAVTRHADARTQKGS